jgi:monoamine oxidase
VSSMARRDVLKLAGGALAARTAHAAGKTTKKVVVAGAGISGLCCAYDLMKRGHDVTLLEALGRAGGHILTVRDNLADGLYADAGAEHFYQHGYDECWRYLQEFDLPIVRYPRRDSMIRFLHGRPYTEEKLADREVLREFELNRREIEYLARHSWPDLLTLYLAPYLDSFPGEDRPFDAGLNHLDRMTVTDLLKKDGASSATIGFIGGSRSALHTVWQAAIKKRRGVAQYVREVNRIEGGNQRIADALAAKLGPRLRLGSPLTGIVHGESGVTVEYKEFGRAKRADTDYLVLSMSFRALREMPVTPGWPDAKRFVIDNMQYDLKARVIFQSRSRFWARDGLSPNITFSEAELTDVWQMAEEVRTPRGLLIGQARTSSIDTALAKFRQLYPGKSEDIEQGQMVNWTLDPWAGSCLPLLRPPGELALFWPEVARPYGRIHFASVCVDPLTNGLEAGIRAARRAAEAIHNA